MAGPLQQPLDAWLHLNPTLGRAGRVGAAKLPIHFPKTLDLLLTAQETCFQSRSPRSSGNVTPQHLLCHSLNHSFPVTSMPSWTEKECLEAKRKHIIFLWVNLEQKTFGRWTKKIPFHTKFHTKIYKNLVSSFPCLLGVRVKSLL